MDNQIAELLAECLAWMEETGGSITQAAARHPKYRDTLAALLETYETVREVPKPSPRPEFKAVARTRLQNQLSDQNKPVVTNLLGSRPIGRVNKKPRRFAMTWLVLVGMAATLLLGGGGAAYASTDALPGDLLYPVKTTLQDMELAFNGDETDMDLLVNYMFQNIGEMQQLAAQGNYDALEAGLDEYEENLDQFVQTRARVSYEDVPASDALLTRLQDQLHTQLDLLEQLKLQTQDQLRIQDRLHQVIEETGAQAGNAYGPNEESGQPEEPGTPNGAGPGEAQGTQEQVQTNQPEDPGNGPGGSNEDGNGNGNPDAGNPDAGTGVGPGDGTGDGICDCTGEDCPVGDQNGNGDGDGICDGTGSQDQDKDQNQDKDQAQDGTGDGDGSGSDGGGSGSGSGGKP